MPPALQQPDPGLQAPAAGPRHFQPLTLGGICSFSFTPALQRSGCSLAPAPSCAPAVPTPEQCSREGAGGLGDTWGPSGQPHPHLEPAKSCCAGTSCPRRVVLGGPRAAQRAPEPGAAGPCVRDERSLLAVGTWGQLMVSFFHISLFSVIFPRAAPAPCLLHGSVAKDVQEWGKG